VIKEKDGVIKVKDGVIKEKDGVIKEKDRVIEDLKSSLSQISKTSWYNNQGKNRGKNRDVYDFMLFFEGFNLLTIKV